MSSLVSASGDPSILAQLSSDYSDESAGYPPGMVRVATCGDKGLGLVAARDIKKGEMVYEEKGGMEVRLTEAQLRYHLENKTAEEKRTFLAHCYCHDAALWYVLGTGR